jgi:Bacterial Ig-like domain
MFGNALVRGVAAGAAISAAGCSFGMTDADLATQLLSVSPRGGTVGVSATPDLVVTFTRPMMAGMEEYLVLHQGGLIGPTMPIRCNWSDDQTTLTCHPTQTLVPTTVYTIHLKGGIMDADGEPVGTRRYGTPMGGAWAGDATHYRFGSGGGGWHTPTWSRGMLFEFTTL